MNFGEPASVNDLREAAWQQMHSNPNHCCSLATHWAYLRPAQRNSLRCYSCLSPPLAQATVETVPLTFVFNFFPFTTTVASFDAAGCREGELAFLQKYNPGGTYDPGFFDLWHYSMKSDTCYYQSKIGWLPGNFGTLSYKCDYQGSPAIPFTVNLVTQTCDRVSNLNITLSGNTSIEPWHKKRDPNHTNANLPYKAIVKDQNGRPKANENVTITTDVTSDSGGHVHANGRPKGRLVDKTGATVSTKEGKEKLEGKTDSSGVFEFTFGAEEASGTHTLTAKCYSGCQTPATATVKAEIKGLVLLDADPLGYELRGSLDPHPGNHYFSSDAIIQIINLAHGYKQKFGELLKINDSSLINGGLFDISGNWTPSHKAHRKGIVLDINNYRVDPNPDFEILAKKYGITPVWEDLDVTLTPHYHLWLTGKDN